MDQGWRGRLIEWYDREKRDLPWRRAKDPYAIWVSEAMLQQTQVATVIPYWERWLATFPTVESLAAATDEEAMALWQGLGYYRRCRFLRKGAEYVVRHGMPTTAAGWREVPGVGPYTAGAIASIAFGDEAALVDGNVERVYARMGADAKTATALNRAAWTWAERSLLRERPGDWNQALMELGATVCKPVEPRCPECPVEAFCAARQAGEVDRYPQREAKRAAVDLRHIVWVPVYEGRFGMRQIPAGVWWEGMWEFPRLDATASPNPDPLREIVGPGWVQEAGTFRHGVTHHRIKVEVSLVRCESARSELSWFAEDELAGVPIPAPQRKALGLVKRVL
ncbi:A/G-specific adenine glycosylase [soil metagenome]